MKAAFRSRTTTRLRYVPEAAYRRGGETRERLIGAAIRLFGESGFDAASTREIAAAASLNTPALQYYFDNKEGLYAACAGHIVVRAWRTMREPVLEAERLLRVGADDAHLIEAFCRLQAGFADSLADAGGEWLLWMAREQAASRRGASTLRNHRVSRRMMRAGRALVARLGRRPPGDPEILLHAMALEGGLVRFMSMRHDAMQTLGWKGLDAEKLALIKRVTREHSQAVLGALVAARCKGSRSGTARSS